MSRISLVDIGVKWFIDIISKIAEWFELGLEKGYKDLSEAFFGTSTPITDGSFVFGKPTNEPWTELYNVLVGGEIMLLALLILVTCIQGRHTIRIFNFGSAYQAQKASKTAWTGALIIVTWYWVGVLMLYLVDGFTIALLPDYEIISQAMPSFLSVSISNPALGVLLAFSGGLAMWVLQVLFFLREILIYIYFYAMPIGVAVAYGHLPIVSQIARTMCMKFIPLAVMPLPVALLFKGYELLFADGLDSTLVPESPFLRYLIAVSLPVLGVFIVWRLFKFATPLATKAIGVAAGATITAGAVLGAGYVAGPTAATTPARWGPKAALTHAAVQRASSSETTQADSDTRSAIPPNGTTHDNVTTDAYGQQGVPTYRRTENDPGYY